MPLSPVPFLGSAPPSPSSVTVIISIPPRCLMSTQARLPCACLDTFATISFTAK
jgi:hypothetical protein